MQQWPARQALLPGVSAAAAGLLLRVPVEVLPLYTLLVSLHAHLEGQPATSCTFTCPLLGQALRHLGFESEIVVVAAELVSQSTGETSYLGDATPTVDDSGLWTGHSVVWVEPLKRLVDPTISQSWLIQREVKRHPERGLALVLPLPGWQVLDERMPATIRGDVVITYRPLPQCAESWRQGPRISEGELRQWSLLLVDHALSILRHPLLQDRAHDMPYSHLRALVEGSVPLSSP